ncbi:hypothetical protein DF186_21995, partial [Enterococcus hirae]
SSTRGRRTSPSWWPSTAGPAAATPRRIIRPWTGGPSGSTTTWRTCPPRSRWSARPWASPSPPAGTSSTRTGWPGWSTPGRV